MIDFLNINQQSSKKVNEIKNILNERAIVNDYRDLKSYQSIKSGSNFSKTNKTLQRRRKKTTTYTRKSSRYCVQTAKTHGLYIGGVNTTIKLLFR
jgi:hypothetical protein